MATMATASVLDVGPNEGQVRNKPVARIDLANIADVPYYVESMGAIISRSIHS